MAYILQSSCHLYSTLHSLLRYLVADTPHDYRRMVAMCLDQILHILVAPFLEEARIAILAFGIYPHVEALCHHHDAHRVADIHLHLARHVV